MAYRVGILRRLGLKTGIHFAHIGLESGMLSKEPRSVLMHLSFQFQMSKKKRERNIFQLIFGGTLRKEIILWN